METIMKNDEKKQSFISIAFGTAKEEDVEVLRKLKEYCKDHDTNCNSFIKRAIAERLAKVAA